MTSAGLRPFGAPEWKASFKALPDSIGKAWGQRSEKYMATPVSTEYADLAEWMLKMIRTLTDHEIELMAGTDTPLFFLTPGFSLHEELALLVRGGLTPLEALDAATLQPARYFGMEDKLGSIENGMFADLVLLKANPLENIRNTSKIEAVIRDGKLYDQKSLDSLRLKLETR